MRIRVATLNCWGGRLFDPLMQFFDKYAYPIDVFCLQEVPMGTHAETNAAGSRDNLFAEIGARLPGHIGFRHESNSTMYCSTPMRHGTTVGMATFASHDLQPRIESELLLYNPESDRGLHPELKATGRLCSLRLSPQNRQPVVLANVHGLWEREGKIDTPARIEQSGRILNFVGRQNGKPLILAGDFNLDLNQRATSMLEEAGLENQIRRFEIPTTRTEHYNPATPKKHLYADYIFTRGGKVENCRVMPEAVSDHACVVADLILP